MAGRCRISLASCCQQDAHVRTRQHNTPDVGRAVEFAEEPREATPPLSMHTPDTHGTRTPLHSPDFAPSSKADRQQNQLNGRYRQRGALKKQNTETKAWENSSFASCLPYPDCLKTDPAKSECLSSVSHKQNAQYHGRRENILRPSPRRSPVYS